MYNTFHPVFDVAVYIFTIVSSRTSHSANKEEYLNCYLRKNMKVMYLYWNYLLCFIMHIMQFSQKRYTVFS